MYVCKLLTSTVYTESKIPYLWQSTVCVPPSQMQHLGMISNSLSGLSSPEALDPSSDTSGESQAMSDHDLLYCFRRDSNKVQNYLKILKCRIVPENGC
uniref:Prolactin n=1 Tax=Oncorhynchus kisutch TaxID=8019 RepID=A0A8C7J5I2_ONCKI